MLFNKAQVRLKHVAILENTIRDGGSIALNCLFTVYTIQSTLHCLNSSRNFWQGKNTFRNGCWASQQNVDCYDLHVKSEHRVMFTFNIH